MVMRLKCPKVRLKVQSCASEWPMSIGHAFVYMIAKFAHRVWVLGFIVRVIGYSECNNNGVISPPDFHKHAFETFTRKCFPLIATRFSRELIFPLLFIELSLQSVYKKWKRIALRWLNSEVLFNALSCTIFSNLNVGRNGSHTHMQTLSLAGLHA